MVSQVYGRVAEPGSGIPANHDRCRIARGGYLSADATRPNHYQKEKLLFFFFWMMIRPSDTRQGSHHAICLCPMLRSYPRWGLGKATHGPMTNQDQDEGYILSFPWKIIGRLRHVSIDPPTCDPMPPAHVADYIFAAPPPDPSIPLGDLHRPHETFQGSNIGYAELANEAGLTIP